MPRLDDTAVEEGLQRLPGWERRGNQIVKTFVREDFAQAMVLINEVAGCHSPAAVRPAAGEYMPIGPAAFLAHKVRTSIAPPVAQLAPAPPHVTSAGRAQSPATK